jgi:hypothetical protein
MIHSARMEAVLRTAAAAALAVLLVVATPGSAGAASTITRSDLTGTSFVNPCTAEVITITGGSFQLIASVTADAAGGLHLDIRGSAQGVEALGATSGDMYRLSGDFWSQQSIRDASYPLTVQLVEVHNAISAGSASNFTIHVVRHLTVTAQGDATATVDAVRAECRS